MEDFCWLLTVPVDGQTLTTIMHSRGINMRYLGQIAQLSADKIAVIYELAIREMVTRAGKHVLRKILSVTEDYNLSPVISHFLNCLMGNVTQPATVTLGQQLVSSSTKASGTSISISIYLFIFVPISLSIFISFFITYPYHPHNHSSEKEKEQKEKIRRRRRRRFWYSHPHVIYCSSSCFSSFKPSKFLALFCLFVCFGFV